MNSPFFAASRWFLVLYFTIQLFTSASESDSEREVEGDYGLQSRSSASSSSEEDSETLKINFSESFLLPNYGIKVDKNTPEDALINSYANMINANDIKNFQRNAKSFYEKIYYLTDKDNIGNQTTYIKVAEDLNSKLFRIPEIFSDYFDNHIIRLSNRIDLARLDQQIFTGEGVRDSFVHPGIPQEARDVLNTLVGKIYRIIKIDEESDNDESQGKLGSKKKKDDVESVGSGMLASLGSHGLPANLSPNAKLNGIITAGHNLSVAHSYPVVGVYFIANEHLDPKTSLPVDEEGNPLKTNKQLVQYLKKNPNSFKIEMYAIRKRTSEGLKVYDHNKIVSTQPLYLDNEDIVFAKFGKEKFRRYPHSIIVDVGILHKGKAHGTKFGVEDTYFAIGYPGCPHYDVRNYSDNLLLDENGLFPLFVTSAHFERKRMDSEEKKRPHFNNGQILHRAPTASGMSGGPLIKIINPSTIKVFGCITGSTEEEEMGCY